MAASRLSDAQKDEIVAAFRQGATAAALASAFGCSPNTVSRVVKAALSPEDYAALKLQRGKGEAGVAPPDVDTATQGSTDEPDEEEALPAAVAVAAVAVAAEAGPEVVGSDDGDGPGVLPIDDADDFAGEDADPDGEDIDELNGADDDDLALVVAGSEPVQCRCLSEAQLPATAYLLVDKTVELQPVALADCPDLGPLPEEESVRQALQVYVNPRHAKRQCGRSQRVIPLPDLSLLQRTAPYLLAQGISRVVIEGSLYSLPGS
jgi:transposase-like protein